MFNRISIFFSLGCLCGLLLFAQEGWSFDLAKVRELGIKAYNNQDYQKAKAHFVKVVQHNSTYAPDYLKLARSSYYAEEFELAHVAYLMFFELDPNQKRGGILEEFKGVKSKTDRARVLRRKRAYRDRLESALKKIAKGELQGKEGAFSTLNQVYNDQIFEPRMRLAVKHFKESIVQKVDHFIHLWLSLKEQNSISKLVKFRQWLKEVQKASWIDSEDLKKTRYTLHALSVLYTNPKRALTLLLKIKDWDQTLRLMQVMALGKANRIDEALDLLSALNEQQTPPLPHLLLLESQWRAQKGQIKRAGKSFAQAGRLIARQRAQSQQKEPLSGEKKSAKDSKKEINE